jgi:hypothetical protein
MNTLRLFSNQDLLLILKEETKSLDEGVKNKIPAIYLENINTTIVDIAVELFSRMPLDTKVVDLTK